MVSTSIAESNRQLAVNAPDVKVVVDSLFQLQMGKNLGRWGLTV